MTVSTWKPAVTGVGSVPAPDAGTVGSPASFGEDGSGNLYIVDHGGEVFRLTPDGTSADQFDKGQIVEGNLLGATGCVSKHPFGDYSLHIEFRTPFEPFAGGQGRGNSGVYVCGREVQVLDSFGLTGTKNECGAIYDERAPTVNMCLPPLVWQTYEIEHRAGTVDPDTKKAGSPRITVWHNGVMVHENFELKGGASQGNINLQDHSNPVLYRNIWLMELK